MADSQLVLDDEVKMNFEKFGDLLAQVKDVTGKSQLFSDGAIG